MTSSWMLYCAVLAGMLGGGALAAERALHSFGRPTRWAWVVAVVLSAALPFASPYLGGLRTALFAPAPAVTLGEGTAEVVRLASAAPAPPPGGLREILLRADGLLLPAWLAASLLLLLGGGVLAARIHLRRRGWRSETVDGERVLVSPRTGPAVVGFLRGRIVLPEWVLAWDEPRRRLVLEHEREHVRAHDPLLLLLALAAVVLVPWSPALWWQLRRLRLAMEVDCDARVLHRLPDVRGYGMLLLEVGRLASSGRLPAAAMSEPTSFLERRIHMMTSPRNARRLRVAALAAGLCLAVAATAVALPAPLSPIPERLTPATADPARAEFRVAPPLVGGDTIIDVSRADEKPRLLNAGAVARMLQQNYPPLLRDAGVTGRATVRIVVGEDGTVADSRTLEATHPAFSDLAATVIRQARFRPARKGGKPVAVRVTLPVAFTLSGSAPVTAPSETEPQVGAVDASRLTVRPKLLNAAEAQATVVAAYPPLLRAAGIPGTAMVGFVLDEHGAVTSPQVVQASRPEFGEAAVAVARKLRFSPGELDGKVVPARVTMPISFSPDAGAPPSPTRAGAARPDTTPAVTATAIRAAIRRYAASVLSTAPDVATTVAFLVDSRGEVRYLPTLTAQGKAEPTAADGPAASRTFVHGAEIRPEVPGVDPHTIESVELRRFRAGEMGSGPVNVVWMTQGRDTGR